MAIGAAPRRSPAYYGHRLGEIETPTMLICGSEDHGAPPENTRQMHAAIKGSRFIEIKQAGHISNIEQPAIFAKAVLDFFGDVDRTAGALPAG
jgi:pimeloyl-ACP methyl ester carboxylesterase